MDSIIQEYNKITKGIAVQWLAGQMARWVGQLQQDIGRATTPCTSEQEKGKAEEMAPVPTRQHDNECVQ